MDIVHSLYNGLSDRRFTGDEPIQSARHPALGQQFSPATTPSLQGSSPSQAEQRQQEDHRARQADRRNEQLRGIRRSLEQRPEQGSGYGRVPSSPEAQQRNQAATDRRTQNAVDVFRGYDTSEPVSTDTLRSVLRDREVAAADTAGPGGLGTIYAKPDRVLNVAGATMGGQFPARQETTALRPFAAFAGEPRTNVEWPSTLYQRPPGEPGGPSSLGSLYAQPGEVHPVAGPTFDAQRGTRSDNAAMMRRMMMRQWNTSDRGAGNLSAGQFGNDESEAM